MAKTSPIWRTNGSEADLAVDFLVIANLAIRGRKLSIGGPTFYFSSEQGLRIISWKDKGLTYAQVSDLDVKGAESYAICHGADGDRRKFEGLGKRM